MERLRAAIVGCGGIAGMLDGNPFIRAAYRVATHAGAYHAHPAFEPVGACDPSPEARERFGEVWPGMSLYPDVASLVVAERPEVVSIASPPSCRDEAFEAIVASGCVRLVLCEKPLAIRAYEAQRFVRLCAEADIRLVVNYLRRFDASHARARQVIAGGALGDIQSAGIVYSDGVRNTATHLLDFAAWCFGEPVWARATGSRESVAGDPVLDGQVAYASGVVVTLSGIGGCGLRVATCDVYGTNGRLVIDREGFSLRHYRAVPHARIEDRMQLESEGEELQPTIGEAMLDVLEACAGTLLRGEDVPCSGGDGVAVLLVVEALEDSLGARGEWRPCGEAPGAWKK